MKTDTLKIETSRGIYACTRKEGDRWNVEFTAINSPQSDDIRATFSLSGAWSETRLMQFIMSFDKNFI